MEIYICNYKNGNELKEVFCKLKDIKNKLIVLSFCEGSAFFLSRYYYNILRICKSFSLKNNNKILMCFYIKRQTRKYVNALYISNGEVVNLFGESFSNKHFITYYSRGYILILFYFDLFSNKILKQVEINKLVAVLGIDDEEEYDFNKYIKKKFDKKIVIIEKNNNLVFAKDKNILKKEENIIKLNVQNLT